MANPAGYRRRLFGRVADRFRPTGAESTHGADVDPVSALLQATGSVFMRGLHGLGPINFQGWTAAFSLPVMLLATLSLENDQMAVMAAADALHWAALLYSVFMASLVGHGLFFFLVQRHPLPVLMPFMLLAPLMATLFGVLVWGDRPGWRLLAGGTLVLSGILFITLRGRARALSAQAGTTA